MRQQRQQHLPWWLWALYVAALPVALASGWLWVNLGHWPAWYIYPAVVVGWLAMGVVIVIGMRETR